MKKQIVKPGFEFILALSIMAIVGLPPLVLAQTQKNIEIRIINGDTAINGKDIKKLNVQERKDALAEMDNMPNGRTKEIIIERSIVNNSDIPMVSGMNDSSRKMFTYRFNKADGSDSSIAFDYKFDVDPKLRVKLNRDFKFDRMNNDRFEFNCRNTQTFNYSSTDNDGISTSINFRVSNVSKDKFKALTGIEKAELTIKDLSLMPEFSTGKTLLSFNLGTKTTAEVKLTGTNGDVLFSDKASGGSSTTKVSLPLNGIYYLQVKQGKAVAVKQIIKQD